MKEMVIRAKLILSNIFGFESIHFDKHRTRKTNVMEGRRYLIYFLREELELTYEVILTFVPAITNHATIIHHFKAMKKLMEVERKTRNLYAEFKSQMLDSPNHLIEKEIIKKLEDRKEINNDLYKLKKLL